MMLINIASLSSTPDTAALEWMDVIIWRYYQERNLIITIPDMSPLWGPDREQIF